MRPPLPSLLLLLFGSAEAACAAFLRPSGLSVLPANPPPPASSSISRLRSAAPIDEDGGGGRVGGAQPGGESRLMTPPPSPPSIDSGSDRSGRRFVLSAAATAAVVVVGGGSDALADGGGGGGSGGGGGFALPDFLGGSKDRRGRPRLGGLANKIRSVTFVMDELQRDLMQERWDLVETYPEQLRSYVPVFTTFTDSAFPTDAPSDKGLRVALRYEVGRFFASVERLRSATRRKALDEAYVAYSDMSLHLDRYMHVGGLYTYYDDVVSTEDYFTGIRKDALVYSDPIKDPAEVRDLVVLAKGPDMGKTGILIGIYPDGSNNCVVKLDKYKGMREIRVVPRSWAAKRLGEQDPDEVFLIPRKNS